MIDKPLHQIGTKSRPLSPHLQIYRPQLTSVLSILHRMTGAALIVGLFIISGWIISAALGAQTYANFTSLLDSVIGILLLVGFSWALFYHLCNGIRHLFWDAGLGLELKDAYRSGWTVVVCSFLLTALCWGSVYYVKHNTLNLSGATQNTMIPAAPDTNTSLPDATAPEENTTPEPQNPAVTDTLSGVSE